jgi:serine phosphatase RsbU (regulator of sigma subunit)
MSPDLDHSSVPHNKREDTDIIVALFRAALIIVLLILPPETRGLLGAPPFIRTMLTFGALYTFIQAVLFFANYSMHTYRPITLAVDLLLVTAITATFAQSGRDLFQIYYILVITGAVWYRRSGAIITALAALGLSFIVEYHLTGADPAGLAYQFAVTRVPWVLLVAIFAAYLVRARDSERELNIQIDHELRLARHLQAHMLPERLPRVPGLDIALRFNPARYVGGDLYAIQTLQDGRILIVLADVAGKSVYGLVHLSALNSHLTAAVHEGLSPAEIATRINRGIYESLQPDSYAAVVIAAIDLNADNIEFVNCGHLPPLRLRHSDPDDVVQLSSGSILIGAVENPSYENHTEAFEATDTLVFYTDGISEVRGRDNKQFGAQGVLRAIAEMRHQDAEAIAKSVMTARQAFAAANAAADDATLIVLRRCPDSEANAHSA